MGEWSVGGTLRTHTFIKYQFQHSLFYPKAITMVTSKSQITMINVIIMKKFEIL